ncbi:probable aquaporin NIP-type [Zingiber officinale]|uniref:probable aquaporin NIP-type n=1 Tax=Zingiber officinale TaxID=94328 RepID=UPI001C4B36BC|nr:probable aquaporin NIP-type [Zingiber officinale]
MASNVEEHSDDRLENTPSTIQKAAAEFIGTYILIFIGCGSVFVNLSLSDIGLLGVAFAWGVVVTAVVYTIEHISGAHLNPAVTIATAVVSKLPWIIVPSNPKS